MKITLFIILSILFVSCNLYKESKNEAKNIQTNDTSNIYFLVFKISKDSISNKSKIELIKKTKIAGKLKEMGEPSAYENYLTIDIFQNKQVARTVTIEHPLYKHVEYIDENGNFVAKNLELKKADFFVRCQLIGKLDEMKIYETLKSKAKKNLTTIKF